MTSLTKNLKPKTKKMYFIADSNACRVFCGLKQLSSTIDWGVMPLLRHMIYA